MSEKTVLVQTANHICTVTMNRPGKMNAMNQDLTLSLLDAFETAAADKRIRVIVLAGAGGNFSTGADMNLLEEVHGVHEWLDGMRTVGRLISVIREAPQPVIARLEGTAYGAGANLALAADFVIAAHNAQFCESFVHIGAVLDAGGTYFLPRLVGQVRAKALALLGDPIDGREAAEMGLIYAAVPQKELDGAVSALAQKLAQKSPRAVALIKEGLENSFDKPLKETLNWEAAHQAIMLQSPEHKEMLQMIFAARRQKKNTGP